MNKKFWDKSLYNVHVYVCYSENSPTRAPNATMASNAWTSRPCGPVRAPLLQCSLSLSDTSCIRTCASVTEAIKMKKSSWILSVLHHNVHISNSCTARNTIISLTTKQCTKLNLTANNRISSTSSSEGCCKWTTFHSLTRHYQHIVNIPNLAICSLAFAIVIINYAAKLMWLIANKLQACFSIRITFFKSMLTSQMTVTSC